MLFLHTIRHCLDDIIVTEQCCSYTQLDIV